MKSIQHATCPLVCLSPTLVVDFCLDWSDSSLHASLSIWLKVVNSSFLGWRASLSLSSWSPLKKLTFRISGSPPSYLESSNFESWYKIDSSLEANSVRDSFSLCVVENNSDSSTSPSATSSYRVSRASIISSYDAVCPRHHTTSAAGDLRDHLIAWITAFFE